MVVSAHPEFEKLLQSYHRREMSPPGAPPVSFIDRLLSAPVAPVRTDTPEYGLWLKNMYQRALDIHLSAIQVLNDANVANFFFTGHYGRSKIPSIFELRQHLDLEQVGHLIEQAARKGPYTAEAVYKFLHGEHALNDRDRVTYLLGQYIGAHAETVEDLERGFETIEIILQNINDTEWDKNLLRHLTTQGILSEAKIEGRSEQVLDLMEQIYPRLHVEVQIYFLSRLNDEGIKGLEVAERAVLGFPDIRISSAAAHSLLKSRDSRAGEIVRRIVRENRNRAASLPMSSFNYRLSNDATLIGKEGESARAMVKWMEQQEAYKKDAAFIRGHSPAFQTQTSPATCDIKLKKKEPKS